MKPAGFNRTRGSLVDTAADVSVVICSYSDARWGSLCAAVASAASQRPAPREVIVVVDHNPPLLDRVQAAMGDVLAVANSQPNGLSGARNTGIALASGEVIAFLDDDATADPGWLHGLLAPFEDQQVLVTGGRIEPVWHPRRPRWFPAEFDWVVGCSYKGQAISKSVRNPIGASMAFRRSVFEGVGGFRSEVGRVGAVPVGCEETELCLRALHKWPAGRVTIEEQSLVHHQVPSSRGSVRYFVARCYAEGSSKAIVGKLAGSKRGLAAERTYVLRAIPRGAFIGIASAFRGDFWGAARAAAIVVGLVTTASGYAIGRLRLATARRSGASSPPEITSS